MSIVFDWSKNAKKLIKGVLPAPVVQAGRNYLTVRRDAKFGKLHVKDVFTTIYAQRLWGPPQREEHQFNSGSGTSRSALTATYVAAVSAFLRSLDTKQNVVDLGCGDFVVGSQVRHLCAHYVACDVVDSLIASNQTKYRDMSVDFRVLDITADSLPAGDLVFVRQVLQHLSNDLILKVLPKIVLGYRYLVLTEHLPSGVFTPNADKPTGPGIRVIAGSGVVLTQPPFNMQPAHERILCEADADGSTIRTTLYQFY